MNKEALKQLRIELTRKCNLECRDCYNLQFKNLGEEISIREITSLIREALPLGLQKVSFSGGEPLIEYDKLKTLIEFSNSLGLETGLLTNATLADDERVSELEKLGLNWARLSLDGSNQQVNSLTRGNSFDSALQGIKAFCRSGIYTVLRSTIHKQNAQDLDNIINLASQIGVSGLELQSYIILTKADINSKFDLPADLQEQLATKILRIKRERTGKPEIHILSGWFEFLSPEFKPEAFSEDCYCLHPDFYRIEALHVDSFGNLRTCGCNSISFGNIKTDSLEEVFFNNPQIMALRTYDASKYCPKCSYASLCSPCPAPRANIYGTLNAANPNCPKVKKGENK
ncbi:MAG: radical SAM protein [Nanoarchaeota archaeon]|nr:radical SAM protein [Nanoarchaeota archaeon]